MAAQVQLETGPILTIIFTISLILFNTRLEDEDNIAYFVYIIYDQSLTDTPLFWSARYSMYISLTRGCRRTHP